MDIRFQKVSLVSAARKIIFIMPFSLCFFIQLSKINTDIMNFSEVWLILSPFNLLEAMKAGHTPYYYYLVRFFQVFNVFDIKPYVYLRFINCLFNIAALLYIYKTIKEIFDPKTAFWTTFCFSLGSFFLETTITAIRYPIVNFLFFFSLYNFLAYLRTKSNRYYYFFVASELLVTSLDFHAVFGCLFKLLFILFFRKQLDRKLIVAAVVVGINFIFTNIFIYILARPELGKHLHWLAALNNFGYFKNAFVPNFFFNTLAFKSLRFMWTSFFILFFLIIFILNKIRDRRAGIIILFLSTCFLLLGLAQYATKIQYFMAKYLIFLIPFVLSLFFYAMPGRKNILAYLFCAFIGYNTVIFYPTICSSKYSHIFRDIEKYRPTICLNRHDGYVPQTIVESLYPDIKIKRSGWIRACLYGINETILVVSRYETSYFNENRDEILNIYVPRYNKIIDHLVDEAAILVYSIYSRKQEIH